MFTRFFTLSSLEKAVLATVAYVDQFDYPLTIDQVVERCLAVDTTPRVSSKKGAREISQGVRELVEAGLLESRGEYVALAGSGALDCVRIESEQRAHAKDQEVARVVHFCQRISWISAVYLTGSLAMGVATTRSDIDFMIVTHPKRVWITRAVLSVFAQLHGRRRTWSREEPGSWCFNLWLDDDHLAMPKTYHDVYRAYEVIQAKEVYARAGGEEGEVSNALRRRNSWIEPFFFCTKKLGVQHASLRARRHLIREGRYVQVFARGWDLLDWLAWRAQSWYMRRHQTIERVGRGYAFFHPRDTRKELYLGWLSSLEKVLPKKDAQAVIERYTAVNVGKRI